MSFLLLYKLQKSPNVNVCAYYVKVERVTYYMQLKPAALGRLSVHWRVYNVHTSPQDRGNNETFTALRHSGYTIKSVKTKVEISRSSNSAEFSFFLFKPLTGAEQRPLYSSAVIGTLAVDGWGSYIWYSEEGPGSPLLAVPNVTAHPSTASVPTSYYSL